VPAAALGRVLFFAGLGLDGGLRPVPGVLPAVTAAQAAAFGAVVLAAQDAAGATPVPGIGVIAASSLTAVADWLRGAPADGSLPAGLIVPPEPSGDRGAAPSPGQRSFT